MTVWLEPLREGAWVDGGEPDPRRDEQADYDEDGRGAEPRELVHTPA